MPPVDDDLTGTHIVEEDGVIMPQWCQAMVVAGKSNNNPIVSDKHDWNQNGTSMLYGL